MEEEKKLVRRAAAGELDAFAALVSLHEKKVYNLALRMTGNREDAYDLSQEAFLRAWRGLPTFRQEASFSTWLYQMTSNACIDHLRKAKRSKTVSLQFLNDAGEEENLPIPDPAPTPEDSALIAERHEQVERAMNGLEVEYRQVLTMRVIDGMTYDEIAAVLNLKEGTVKSRLSRAREKMRCTLLGDGNKSGAKTSEKQGKGAEACLSAKNTGR